MKAKKRADCEKFILINLVVAVFIITTFSFVSASFAKGNSSMNIQTDYAPSEVLKGLINISLTNESFNSQLVGFSGKGSINIFDFLR